MLSPLSLNFLAVQGCIILSVAHAFSSMGLFLFVGVLAGQVGTRSLSSLCFLGNSSRFLLGLLIGKALKSKSYGSNCNEWWRILRTWLLETLCTIDYVLEICCFFEKCWRIVMILVWYVKGFRRMPLSALVMLVELNSVMFL